MKSRDKIYSTSIVEIRYITPIDDRMEISRIYEESWKYAYKGIIPQDYLDSIPKGRWRTDLENSNWSTLVCIDNGNIVGTSSFCKSRFNQFDGWGEIISVYLLPDYIGKGFGKALLKSIEGFSMTDDYLNDNIGGKDLREIRYIYRG